MTPILRRSSTVDLTVLVAGVVTVVAWIETWQWQYKHYANLGILAVVLAGLLGEYWRQGRTVAR